MSNHGGKRKGSGRSKVADTKRKRPVTTWLSPTEIAALTKIGHKGNAQDGIRVMAKAVSKKKPLPKVKTSKLSRLEGQISITELELLPLHSNRLMLRRGLTLLPS